MFDPNHPRRSIRLQDHDYSQAGAYFITVCTQDRQPILGEIRGGTAELSRFGQIVNDWWFKLPRRFPTVDLDDFVIMPNHFHGIIVLRDHASATSRSDAFSPPRTANGSPPDSRRGLVSKPCNNSPSTYQRRGLVSTPSSEFGKRRFDPLRPTLGDVIAYLKYMTTKEINALSHTPGKRVFQRNYYEHVIRNEADMAEKREYVRNNPMQWELDEYYSS